MKSISLDSIHVDRRVHVRIQGVNDEKVTEYAAGWEGGASLAPVDVFDVSGILYIADGFHRLAAARQLKHTAILATVHSGTLDDARRFSASANLENRSLNLSKHDKFHALALLINFELAGVSNRRIASRFNVAPTTIGRWLDMLDEQGLITVDRTKTLGKDGVVRDTRKIGGMKKAPRRRSVHRKLPIPVLMPSLDAQDAMFPAATKPMIPPGILFPVESQPSWDVFANMFGQKAKTLRKKPAVQQYSYAQSAIQMTWLLSHLIQIIDFDALSAEKQECIVDDLGAIQNELGTIYDRFADRIGV